jgi:hypothetical protein
LIAIFIRFFRIIVVSVCLIPAYSCSGPVETPGPSSLPATTLEELYGQVWSDVPLLFYPAGGWDGAPRKMRWRLTSPATLICQVNRPVEGELHLTLVPANRTAPGAWQPLWNGRAEPSIDISSADGHLRVTVPPGILVPGAHRLTLVRPGASSRDERDPLELEIIEFNCGPLSGALRADLGPRLKRMAGFLDSGVFLSGEGRVRRGGFIFRGPHRRGGPADHNGQPF